MEKPVTATDIRKALERLGITEGDMVLVHSSLRSLGAVEGGAASVIQGFEDLLGKEGTLVMPTLCQVDFKNSYKTWYMDKPSDVGYLSEFFRKQPYVYRSNHPTHSVAARGKHAYTLTCEHSAYGPHLCLYGEYAFADSSPWLKMRKMGAKIVFIGVTTRYNTMKHAVEVQYVEALLEAVKDDRRREALRDQVIRFPHFTGAEVWPMCSGTKMHDLLTQMGLIEHTRCGNADMYCMDMQKSCDAIYEILRAHPEDWCNEQTIRWVKECEKAT